jgi:hypothetical protein
MLVQQTADDFLQALGYPTPKPTVVTVDNYKVPVHLEITSPNGSPLLWCLLALPDETDGNPLRGTFFTAPSDDDINAEPMTTNGLVNEVLISKILFSHGYMPRWILVIGPKNIYLIDRNKWGEKRYLIFDLEEIFSNKEESTLQTMAVLLHKDSLCPADGTSQLDAFEDNSNKHSSEVSEDLKFSLRRAIELLGNEVIYDLVHNHGLNLDTDPIDAKELSNECLRYMYRLLFVLFIESRSELSYAPMNVQIYLQGYSLESLRNISEKIRDDVEEVGDGYYFQETLSKLFELIYDGYPKTNEAFAYLSGLNSFHDVFKIQPLKAHIFDLQYTKMLSKARLRNSVMMQIIDLMSISRGSTKGGSHRRPGRISYSTLGINQLGAAYEALLSYSGFIATEKLYEVKRPQDEYNELNVSYFMTESEFNAYTKGDKKVAETNEEDVDHPKYEKGMFIYRLAGRDRERSASYYTPQSLTTCLVKYTLKELLVDKSADDILKLKICEPAMGSAAFLNEVINQLSAAYLDLKQKETNIFITPGDRNIELQRVKMFIADRNVFGIDLNPIAVELAEVSLWLNTIFEGGFVPWFGTQLFTGNSLIGARREVYSIKQVKTRHDSEKWFNIAPIKLDPYEKSLPADHIYHFLLADPGMAAYSDKVIKTLVPDQIKKIKEWNKNFIQPYKSEEIKTLLRLSAVVDDLFKKQLKLQQDILQKTTDSLSIFGQLNELDPPLTTIREKDEIFDAIYKSVGGNNASPYARLKFAMDYWCSLWFWPIDKVDLLPSRDDFVFDMDLIL